MQFEPLCLIYKHPEVLLNTEFTDIRFFNVLPMCGFESPSKIDAGIFFATSLQRAAGPNSSLGSAVFFYPCGSTESGIFFATSLQSSASSRKRVVEALLFCSIFSRVEVASFLLHLYKGLLEGFHLQGVFLLAESRANRYCTCFLALAVDVAVYISSCSHVAVTEPILYHFHRHTVCEQKRCTTVSKVMESDLL